MTPTPKLRFVKRDIQVPFQNYKDVTESKTVRILQQWWEKKIWAHDDWVVDDGEWRDIPLEKEQA
jgi:hypothetical protein